MRMWEKNAVPCVIMDKQTVSDGYGGYTKEWVEGAGINCAIVLNNSLNTEIAKKQGVTALYTITTSKALNLQFHDVIKRISDGKIFRVTTDGDDDTTPTGASLDMRQVRAEEYNLE